MISGGFNVYPKEVEEAIVRDNLEVNKALASHTALGRVCSPEDVGPVIAGLLSDDFGWVSGQRIEVAGGIPI